MDNNTLIYFFLVILTGMVSCNSGSTSGEVQDNPEMKVEQIAMTQDQLKMAGVEVGKPSRKALEGGISCTGMIDVPPQNMATICAPIGGFVKKLYHIPGEYVRKGSPVAIIEHPNIIQLQQDYLVSKGKLTFLESEYLRKKELVEKDATAIRSFEEAQSNFLVEKAHMEGLQAKLRLIGITPESLDSTGLRTQIYISSPLSGYVTRVNAHTGQYVNPELGIVSVIDKAHMHLELSVFAQDITRVRKGQSIVFQVPGNAETYHGEVYLMGQLVDEESKSLNIHGHIHEEESRQFIPGTYINAVIQTEVDSVYAIPAEAVIRQGDNSYVFVQSDSTFQRHEVMTGRVSGQWIEVREIKDAELTSDIAIKGAYYLQGSL